MVKRYSTSTYILIFVLFGIYVFIFSGSGVLERTKFLSENEKIEKRIHTLTEKNLYLKEVVKKYKAGFLSPDDIHKSGYRERGESLLTIQNPDIEKKKKYVNVKKKKESFFSIQHLRIIWIVISAVIVLLHYKYNSGAKGNGE